MKKQQNPKAKKPTGRPRIELDPKQAKIFGYFRATYDTMAEQIGCHVDTIRKEMQNTDSDFSKAYKKAFSGMKMKLSEAQIKHGLAGNASLLIWLGKQYLGQKDSPDLDGNATPAIVELVPDKLADSDNEIDD